MAAPTEADQILSQTTGGERLARIARAARRLGFDAFGATTPDVLARGPAEAAAALDRFVELGRYGDMSWMADHLERRRDPRMLWPDARSILMLGQSYAPATDPLGVLGDRDRGAISVYARGKDYHDILKARLKQLAREVAAMTGGDVKVFVDTAPLMEKPLAAASGLGWQGKHTNLVSREHGSWLFLGAILSTAELDVSTPEADHCGSCRRCLDVCPTDAFPSPYELDARRCIAYLTIEHKGHIPRALRTPIGNRIFGCDDCLAVCPWNKFAATSREVRFAARAETDNPRLDDLVGLDDGAFRARFAGTPVKRTGRDRFLRNVLIAIGNSADRAYIPQVEGRLGDNSVLVRAAAVWALSRIADANEFRSLAERYRGREQDSDVLDEWRLALEGDCSTHTFTTDTA